MRIGIALTTVLALAGFMQVWLFRRGSLRSLARWYFDPYAPMPLRHLPFFAVPVAVFFSVAALMLVVARLEVIPGMVMMSAMMMVLLSALAASVALSLYPPSWLKPSWMKEEEVSHLSKAMAAEREAMVPVEPGE